jgi:hypothetical protein
MLEKGEAVTPFFVCLYCNDMVGIDGNIFIEYIPSIRRCLVPVLNHLNTKLKVLI